VDRWLEINPQAPGVTNDRQVSRCRPAAPAGSQTPSNHSMTQTGGETGVEATSRFNEAALDLQGGGYSWHRTIAGAVNNAGATVAPAHPRAPLMVSGSYASGSTV